MTRKNPSTVKPLNRAEQSSEFRHLLNQVPNLRNVFSEIDPFSAAFHSDLQVSLRNAYAGNWQRIKSALVEYSHESALRQLWAIAVLSPISLAGLYRSILLSEDGDLRVLAEQLLRITPNVIDQDPLASAVAFPPNAAPDFSECRLLMPGIRLRYALANGLSAGLRTADFVAVAAGLPDASEYVKRRELHRLLKVSDDLGKPLSPYTSTQILMIPAREHQLLVSSPTLIQRLTPISLHKKKDLKKWFADQRDEREKSSEILSKVLQRINSRNFSNIGKLINELRVNSLTRAVASSLIYSKEKSGNDGPLYGSATEEIGSSKHRWVPLEVVDLDALRKIFPKNAIFEWWTWGATEIALALSKNELSPRKLNNRDRELLPATWGIKEQQKIFESELHGLLGPNSKVWLKQDFVDLWKLIRQRADCDAILSEYVRLDRNIPSVLAGLGHIADNTARRALEKACWNGMECESIGARVIQWAGTNEWSAAGGWNLSRSPLADIAAFGKNPKKPLDSTRFRSTLVTFLLQAKLKTGLTKWQRESGTTPFAVCVDLAKSDVEFLSLFAAQADQEWLKGFTDACAGEPALLLALQPILPAELKEHAFRVRIYYEDDPNVLQRYLVEGAHQNFETPWNPQWLNLIRSSEERTSIGATVVVLALRRNLKYLKRVCLGVPPEVVSAALSSAVESLSGAPGRDKALMELVSAVGIEAGPCMAAAVAMCDRNEKPGHRLDHAYHQWSLPKKSGGTRTISAPCAQLKKAQRALLGCLLNPLGAHPAAYGFVRGRSIKGNALVHIGQEIVANVDVKNCFPSVRWPLVLGALRRDLCGQFSASAIGLLVDICTSEGGLPIGAPTSPALLNRVLQISDEILTKQAEKRGCKYSRYADDLTFSGDHGAVEMIGVAKSTLQRIGLELDPKKTNIFRRGRRQVCTGLVVNVQVSVPRTVRRRIRAAVHAVESGREPRWHGNPESLAAIGGRLAFLQMVHLEEGGKLQARLKIAIGGSQAATNDDIEPA